MENDFLLASWPIWKKKPSTKIAKFYFFLIRKVHLTKCRRSCSAYIFLNFYPLPERCDLTSVSVKKMYARWRVAHLCLNALSAYPYACSERAADVLDQSECVYLGGPPPRHHTFSEAVAKSTIAFLAYPTVLCFSFSSTDLNSLLSFSVTHIIVYFGQIEVLPFYLKVQSTPANLARSGGRSAIKT